MRIFSNSGRNRKAEQLCRVIGEQQESFSIHGFNFDDYEGEDISRIRQISKFFGLKSVYDCMVLCFFIEKKLSGDQAVNWSQIIDHFSIDLQGCVQMNTTIQSLMKKQLIHSPDRYRSRESEYCLTKSCLTAILNYKPLTMKKGDSFIDGFMKEFDAVIKNIDEFQDEEVLPQLTQIVVEYKSLPEIQWLKRQNIPSDGMVIFFLALRNYIFLRSSITLEQVLKIITADPLERYLLEKEMKGKNHSLIKGNLLCFETDFFISDSLKLTDRSIKEIFAISRDICVGKMAIYHPKLFKLISPDEIKEEQYLHSNPDLGLIERMVSRETYERIRLKVLGLTILLSGEPGTGKTSFVYQLAKNTGRPILVVNIAKILSCYVGESEKNLIELFDEAASAYAAFPDTPICLFDEAESLLYVRNPHLSGAADHMSNNLISLLLQCLDKFQGILFCCSNFGVKNFDPALSRRFHQIVKVKAPPQNILKSIFQSRFPEFSEEEANTFIEKYNRITPAELENLKNKYQVQMLIQDVIDPRTLLYQLVEQDIDAKNQKRAPMGFRLTR